MDEIVCNIAGRPSVPTTQHIIHLERCFGPLKFVYIRREDVVAQAVSWARAEQTKVWHRTHASDPVQHESPQYSFDLIDMAQVPCKF